MILLALMSQTCHNERMKYLQIKIDESFNEKLKELARARQTNVSQMVRDMLRREVLDFHGSKEQAVLGETTK